MLLHIGLGLALVVLMSVLARSNYSWLNGLVPLFPTFGLIAHLTTSLEKGNAAVKEVAAVGLAALLPYAAYLVSVYVLVDRIGIAKAIGAGLILWIAIASLIVVFGIGRMR